MSTEGIVLKLYNVNSKSRNKTDASASFLNFSIHNFFVIKYYSVLHRTVASVALFLT